MRSREWIASPGDPTVTREKCIANTYLAGDETNTNCQKSGQASACDLQGRIIKFKIQRLIIILLSFFI